MVATEDKKGPGLKFPPPLLAAAVIALAWVADRVYPLAIVAGGALWRSGIVVMTFAFIIALIALRHFFVSKTHVEPWQPTTTIIRHGLYRFSRNPIYLAFCVATLGLGLILNSWWQLLCVPLLVALLQRLVIEREEIYLEAKFGDEYRDYKRRVRRWI